ERLADGRLVRRGGRGEQLGARHDHAGRAEAALHRVARPERLLERTEAVGRSEALDGGDARALELDGQEQAAPGAAPVDQHRARAADAVLAAHVGAGEREVFPEEVRERAARLHHALHRRTVDGETHPQSLGRCGRGAGRHDPRRPTAWRRASSVSTVARCRRYSAEAWTSVAGSQSAAAAAPARAGVAASRGAVATSASAARRRTGRSATPNPTTRAWCL